VFVRGLVRGRVSQDGKFVCLSRTNAQRACPKVAPGTTEPIAPNPTPLLGFEHGFDREDSSDRGGLSHRDRW
jgi:hypothetical protein